MRVVNLGSPLEEVTVLSISDAACAAQAGGGSQEGLLVAMAHPSILLGEAPV